VRSHLQSIPKVSPNSVAFLSNEKQTLKEQKLYSPGQSPYLGPLKKEDAKNHISENFCVVNKE
jgi:hypothetical protein